MSEGKFFAVFGTFVASILGLAGYVVYNHAITPPYKYDTDRKDQTALVYPQSKQVLLRQDDKSAYLVNFEKQKLCTGVLTYRTSGKTTYEFMTGGTCEDFNAVTKAEEKQAIEISSPLLAKGQAKLEKHQK